MNIKINNPIKNKVKLPFFLKPVCIIAVLFVIICVGVLVGFRMGYNTTHLDSFYGTEWVCEDPEIKVKVYDTLGVRGTMTVNGEEIEFIMQHRGGASWVAFCPEDARSHPELENGYYLTGGAYWRKGNYCVNIENDYIGIGADKLVFKKLES